MEKDKNDRVEVIKLPSNVGSNGSFSNKSASGEKIFFKTLDKSFMVIYSFRERLELRRSQLKFEGTFLIPY